MLKPYPEYKDSAVEWIGRVPSDWTLKKLKYVSQINSRSLPETTDEDYEFNYIDISNVDIEKGADLGEKIRFGIAPSRARRVVKRGSSIISTVRTYLKTIAYMDEDVKDVIVSTGFAVVDSNKEIFSKFLYYVLRCEKFVERVCSLSVGVSYPAINPSELSNIVVWFPNKDEQKQIAHCLDYEIRRIDDLIAKKERMIKFLKEERAALINQAVIKGLDPKAEMKDSGIEWLGKIPKHWDIKKLKFNATVQFSNVDKKSEEGEIPVRLCNYVDVYYNDCITPDIDFMEATASSEEINKFHLKCGDVLLTKDSEEWNDIAIPAYMTFEAPDLICGYHLAKVRPQEKVLLGKYLFWLLSADCVNYQFRIEASGVTRYGLSNYALSNSMCLLPPKKEQGAIIALLDQKTAQIDAQISQENKSIELLKEYRAALISEVVTGKIDVRNA